MTGGNALTPTVIRSLTFHCIQGPQGARRNTSGRTVAAVWQRCARRGTVHSERRTLRVERYTVRGAQAMRMCSALDFLRTSCSK